jgi:hypothetical protein
MTETVRNNLLTRLRRVRRAGAGFVALCPVHHDTRPSLSIFPWNGGWLTKCHACNVCTSDVLTAVGLNGRETKHPLTPCSPNGDQTRLAERRREEA